jgi:hypothetical protein
LFSDNCCFGEIDDVCSYSAAPEDFEFQTTVGDSRNQDAMQSKESPRILCHTTRWFILQNLLGVSKVFGVSQSFLKILLASSWTSNGRRQRCENNTVRVILMELLDEIDGFQMKLSSDQAITTPVKTVKPHE